MATTAVAPVHSSRERTLVSDLPERIGARVELRGWFTGMRRAKAIRFLVIRDRSGSVQAIDRGGPAAERLDELTPESAVRVVGTVRECAVARYGPVEIEIESVEVVALARAPIPFDRAGEGEAPPEHRFLELRAPERFLVFDVQTTLEVAMRAFLQSAGFVEIHTPKITAGGSESGATVFELPYFGERACLAQSPQFYMQMAMAAGFDRVFEVGPVFRAEGGVTNRHATEFTCIDVELSWIDSHEELMTLEEDLLCAALAAVRDAHGAEIERLFGVPVEVPDARVPRLPLSLARELTGGASENGRLSHQAEQILSKHAREQTGHSWVFITDYPGGDRPFYTMREGPGSRSFDLLWRGVEITSGCQREHRHDVLRAQVAESGLGSESLSRYLDAYYFEMFRTGCPPHGGFGIGLNRLLMSLLGHSSIRDTSFVFRGPGRFVP